MAHTDHSANSMTQHSHRNLWQCHCYKFAAVVLVDAAEIARRYGCRIAGFAGDILSYICLPNGPTFGLQAAQQQAAAQAAAQRRDEWVYSGIEWCAATAD